MKRSTSTIAKWTFLDREVLIVLTALRTSPISISYLPQKNKSTLNRIKLHSSKPTTLWKTSKMFQSISNLSLCTFFNIKRLLMVFNISSIWVRKINGDNSWKTFSQMPLKITMEMILSWINFSEDKNQKVTERFSKVLYLPFMNA